MITQINLKFTSSFKHYNGWSTHNVPEIRMYKTVSLYVNIQSEIFNKLNTKIIQGIYSIHQSKM